MYLFTLFHLSKEWGGRPSSVGLFAVQDFELFYLSTSRFPILRLQMYKFKLCGHLRLISIIFQKTRTMLKTMKANICRKVLPL